jgi:hypothetical protein
MSGEALRETVSGIEVPESAVPATREMVRIIRDVAAATPFGAEPQDFLVMLEALAQPEDEA